MVILQHQQRSNTNGKNASDIALVIDAMGLMFKGTLDGFCLVSSDNRESAHYERLAPFVGRLAAALARNGRFAGDARVLEIGVALECMYELPEGRLSRALRNRVSGFLGTDVESRERVKDSVRAFYDARSNIAHSRSAKVTPFTNGAAFVTGFGLAR